MKQGPCVALCRGIARESEREQTEGHESPCVYVHERGGGREVEQLLSSERTRATASLTQLNACGLD